MSAPKKKTPAEELIESLLKDVGGDLPESSDDGEGFSLEDSEPTGTSIEGLVLHDEDDSHQGGLMLSSGSEVEYESEVKEEFEPTRNLGGNTAISLQADSFNVDEGENNLAAAMGALKHEENIKQMQTEEIPQSAIPTEKIKLEDAGKTEKFVDDATKPMRLDDVVPVVTSDDSTSRMDSEGTVRLTGVTSSHGDSDKTVAVAGYQVSGGNDYSDRERISVGQNRTGYSSWSGGSAESNLAQAENLRIAQEKILDLEKENEKLRLQNEQLMAASEIIKERSDLLSSQLSEFKRDRDGLEESFKNEIVLLKNHLARKDTELQRAQFKTEELESRLKFDMKKIRIRERELENRLELIRAEKNAIVKNKDEQILDLRRKMDVLQMEVESYRQKCIELNKMIETNQESFKRTTRALRLAMANLELQEENKSPLKKAD